MIKNILWKTWKWCKREVVLSIAVILAVLSAFIVRPDQAYLGYIDFRTLAILFCLMAVMAGLQKIGLFRWVAEKLLSCVRHIRGIVFILVSLCFVSSMIITNDVALITFVPFTFIVLKMVSAEKLIIPVVVMQTIAANLGSMLTPIGNPQNLYLYGKASMGFLDFVLLMLPYTLVSFLLLAIWCLCFLYKGNVHTTMQLESKTALSGCKKQLLLYGGLFLLCLLTVVHILPCEVTFLFVLAVIFFTDRNVLRKVDYGLLFTFAALFVFIGNIGRIPVFNTFLHRIIVGNEVLTGVVASQFMSNVPAALLLSEFTEQNELLIVGTNLGGLGTIIASMASLISFKYIGEECGTQKGKYLLYFTIANLVFLAVLFGVYQLYEFL